MGILELALIGVGLSMDAFAVSICKGLSMRRVNLAHAFVIALFFGVFQAAMPLIGWLIGVNFVAYIEAFDHWIAFVLLAFLGGKMIRDALRGEDDCDCESAQTDDAQRLDVKELFLLAVATSIDALAVGVTFAFLDVNIVFAIAVIGAITFVLSFLGVVLGSRIGQSFSRVATLAGGVILILIGLKILLEHLGILTL